MTAQVGLWAAVCLGSCLLLGGLRWSTEPAEDPLFKQRFVQALTVAPPSPAPHELVVDLSTVTTFAWDSLYTFPGVTTVDLIRQAIGEAWPGTENVHEEDNLLVFTKQGHVVKHVLFRGFNYQREPSFVKFTLHADKGEVFTPATARFQVCPGARLPQWLEVIPVQQPVVHRPAYERYLQRLRATNE